MNSDNKPMTVLEILNRTKAFFEKKGVPDPLLDAQYIISHGLKMKNRMDLYLNFEKPLTPAELDELRPLVARRANREPLQHIIGDTSFRGFRIKCDPRALIPRPETESLVDMAAECVKGIENPFIVEIGTGSGAIAISSAKEIEGAKVFASDISEDALALAKENAALNDIEVRDSKLEVQNEKSEAENNDVESAQAKSIQFAQGDLLQALPADAPKIDCLIANLPYIPDGEKDNLQPEVAKFDPALALFGGADGLDLIRKLLAETEGRMAVNGVILLEIGSEQASILEAEAIKYPWLKFTGIHKDFCDNIRFVSYECIRL